MNPLEQIQYEQQQQMKKMQEYANKAYNQRQIEIRAAAITNASTADIVANNILSETKKYQQELSDTEDVGVAIVQFGQWKTINVIQIGCIGCNLVVFRGTDNDGKLVTLIQHIHQLNFLLIPVSKDTSAPKRQIGFVAE